MAEEKIRFDQLEIGDRFIWKDEEYEKVDTDNLPRYGWVNCQGRAFYEGDTGHRFIDADTPVRKIELPNPDRGMGAQITQKEERKMKTQITSTYYNKEDCPLKEDRLLVADDGGAWLEPELYTVISNEWDEEKQEGTLVIEVNLPEGTCRFLGHSDGSPPACYGFGNPATSGGPWHMEDAPDGFAPDLVCLHCAEYAFGREERSERLDDHRLDDHGVLELLPELNAEELGKYADDPPFFYVDRATGKIA